MDARRLNDVLKLVGAIVAAVNGTILALVPFLSGRPLAVASAVVAVIGSLGGAYTAGFGTRAAGTEYQSIADAKAIAKVSMMPPPMAAAAAAPTGAQPQSKPPPPPTEAL
jgi:hypothetical protein